MKSASVRILLPLALFAAGFSAQAIPVQRADLPSAPLWVVHLDCDKLRSTSIGQFILAEAEKPEVQEKLAGFQSIFSFDPRKQLHAVTLYGIGKSPQDGVLLLYADFDPDRLVTLAQSATDYQTSLHNKHVIHNWVDDKKPARDGVKPRVYAAIQGARVIFGQKEAAVAQALDVLDGTSPRLSGSSSFPDLNKNSSSFLQAAAGNLDLPGEGPHAAIFRLSKQVRLQIGEEQQQIIASLAFEAKDDEVAGHLLSIGQGLVSLMKLQKDKPEATKIADALALKQQGSSFLVTLTLPSKDIVEKMKARAARKAEKNSQ